MQKVLPLSAMFLFAMFLFSTTAFALSLGNQITIYDQKSYGNANYGMGEDQEVEPGMAWHQQWDLEGFFISYNWHYQLSCRDLNMSILPNSAVTIV